MQHFLAKRNLGVQSETIDGANVNELGVLEHLDEWLDAEEVVGGVLIGAPRQRHVEDADAVGLQRALDLANELVRVQRVVEHVGELEIKRIIIERLVVEVTFDNEGRVRDEVDSYGVGDPHAPQRLHLLPHARADAERLGFVVEEVLLLEFLEEAREDGDLAVPVAGGPYFSEPWVEGLVELALYVGLVGGVTGSDSEVFGGGCCGGGRRVGLCGEEVEEEEREGEEEGDEEAPEDEWFRECDFHVRVCVYVCVYLSLDAIASD